MDVTRTALVSKDFKGRYKDKEDAINFAKKVNAKLCSLRYIGNHMECTFGYGVYQDDVLIGCDEYKWI